MTVPPVVLYVEDDPNSCELMQITLVEVLGLTHVTIFRDSENFVERVNALDPPPDVILLDIHVPPYNGFQMLHMLRTQDQFRHLPIAALTASVMNEEVNLLTEAGFTAVLAKPIDVDTFGDTLQGVIARKLH